LEDPLFIRVVLVDGPGQISTDVYLSIYTPYELGLFHLRVTLIHPDQALFETLMPQWISVSRIK
jgi:hypothetical protein